VASSASAAAIPTAVAAADVAAEPLLEVRDLKVWFPITSGMLLSRHVGDIRAVDGVSLTVRRGETLGLVGESGCGKSTTGRAILRLYRPTGGTVRFDGADITKLEGNDLRRVRRRMQMIFQDPYSSLDPRMTAAGIVREPLDIYRVGSSDERHARVRELFQVVGLDPSFGDRYPHEFSGGQRQRIGVARALALNPDLVVADEPISALDVSIQAQIINLLERLQNRMHLAYLFIAHDLSVVRHISDRIAVMYLGRIVETARARDLHTAPRHPYTVALLSAVPIPDPVVESKRRRIILTGDVPNPAAPPPGCHFHTRCWLRERLGNPIECETISPPLSDQGPDHAAACHFASRLADMPEAAPLVLPARRPGAVPAPTSSGSTAPVEPAAPPAPGPGASVPTTAWAPPERRNDS
jgi:oligopeptide transport system ATP-binding protein